MTTEHRYTGGCLCGAVRWSAADAPIYQGYCCCADCRKASGSGFVPFMGFAASAVTITGETLKVRSPAFRGGVALRNACPTCGGLVFGGEVGVDASHTIYAGSLDDATQFAPTMALFLRDKPDWVVLPPGLATFETMPD
ncbi:aldehyde-activating protein [Caulobacter sp. D4A]|uniref:GFA family protein n=1 Tax=unclassified Caulobacter TaxID=2648921 RepID=UPI000D728F7E|nr:MULTISPECIES: GFA family protein [unclassified Caulobacter]PXA75771.1 aldehyde-activating protein [Caulobacter sp. D4A]PXA96322.1 aldehyde-activating protein [Caulobacter sp. D5]